MSDALEYLLGSKAKSRMIKTLILNSRLEFSAQELAKKIRCSGRTVSTELRKMELIGLVTCRKRKNTKHYGLDRKFLFYSELKNIVAKCNLTPESRLLAGIKSAGKITYAVLSGVFTENKKAGADLLIVGDELRRSKLKKVVAEIEADMGKEIRYSIMPSQEFYYRLEMFDKFIMDINKGPHIILVDKTNGKKQRLRG